MFLMFVHNNDDTTLTSAGSEPSPALSFPRCWGTQWADTGWQRTKGHQHFKTFLQRFFIHIFAQAFQGMGDNYKVVSLNDASFRWDPRRCLRCKQCLTSKIPFIRDPVLQGVSSLQAVFDVKINCKPPFRDPVLQGVTTNVKKGELIGVVGKVFCLHFQKWHRYGQSTFLVQNSKSEFLSLVSKLEIWLVL